jgi:hypothetical protein
MSAHRFTVGQTVHFSPDRNQEGAARGSFKVVRLKSQLDGHERVVREDQLTRS